MKIGLYGMPAAGKTYILDRIDFIDVVQGSRLLREMCPEFDVKSPEEKNATRMELANSLKKRDSFIIDGHYAFGDEIAFTESDGQLYDVFLYLYISPDILKERMEKSERNRKYLSFDIEKWQKFEIDSLRKYCHENDKDFYVIDNPPQNYFDNISDIIDFIKDIIEGYSCRAYAESCSKEILEHSKNDTIVLMDGDKTITIQDSSNAVFGYNTHLYDGNFYTGYQSWKQAKEFDLYQVPDLTQMPVSLNKRVCESFSENTYILTSGHEKVWKFISKELNIPFFKGNEMSAETKFFITKYLQNAGKRIVAYGDGMNDYYMLKQADEGYLVLKKDSTISKSLKGRNLEGLNLV